MFRTSLTPRKAHRFLHQFNERKQQLSECCDRSLIKPVKPPIQKFLRDIDMNASDKDNNSNNYDVISLVLIGNWVYDARHYNAEVIVDRIIKILMTAWLFQLIIFSNDKLNNSCVACYLLLSFC